MDIHDLEQIIAEHPLLAGLDSSFTGTLVGCAGNMRFKPDQYIFREGEEANQFYLIRGGRVSLELRAPQKKPIIIETLDAGDILGWSWLLPPYVWKFDARATTATSLIGLDAKCLRTKCEESHDLGYEVLKRFSQIVERRLEATRLQLLDLYAAN